jgi:heme/copper-type cytochrome/quinol oxidase subunit 1
MYNERLGKLHFWLTFVGFNVTFFPMHWLGLAGDAAPRLRLRDRVRRPELRHLASRLRSGASTIVFLYNMIVSWRRGPLAAANPWRALTLEWQVSSPPPIFNFDEIPQIVGGRTSTASRGARTRSSTERVSMRSRRPSRRERHRPVVANETMTGPSLISAVREQDPDLVTVLAPISNPQAGYVVYEDTAARCGPAARAHADEAA